MSPNNLTPTDSGSSLPGKRRQSFLSKARPRTAIFEKSHNTDQSRPHTGIWLPHGDRIGSTAQTFSHAHSDSLDNGKQKNKGVESVGNGDVFEDDTIPFPEMATETTKHRASKSFSSLRHGVSELRAVARRLSLTLRHKSSRLEIPGQVDGGGGSTSGWGSTSPGGEGYDRDRPKTGWFRSQRTHRRPSLSSLSALNSFYNPTYHVTSPIPGHGAEPPILPENLAAGSAARAAAAAQNELAKVGRVVSKGDPRVFDSKHFTDSESGIGIDMRDRVDGSETEREVIRQGLCPFIPQSYLPVVLTFFASIDPVQYLPTELVAHILSYLDPSSLLDAELVSSSWKQEASSHHVWRHVFRRECKGGQSLSKSTKRKRAVGLGKTVPYQDWKRMYFIRQRLENRWKEGKAAAIYLHGHKDSVYCVQFDE